MARAFAGTTSDYGEITTVAAPSMPFTFACWAWSNSAADFACLMQIGESTANDKTHRVLLSNSAPNPFTIRAQSLNGAAGTAITTTSNATGQWFHSCAVFSSTTSRSVYLNGGGKATETTSVTAFTGGRMTFGVYKNASTLYALNGYLAEVGIWNVALSDDEVYRLAQGVTPDRVRGDALVEYWPLTARSFPEHNYAGGADMVLSGAVYPSLHPKIARVRQRRYLWSEAGAAPAGGARRLVSAGFALAGNGRGLAA